MQARAKQRRVVVKKCYAIDSICGQFWKEPSLVKQENEIVESKKDFKEVFRRIVRKVIEKLRCEKVIAAVLDLRREREAFEKLCFQFAEDDESALYRYNIDKNEKQLGTINAFCFKKISEALGRYI